LDNKKLDNDLVDNEIVGYIAVAVVVEELILDLKVFRQCSKYTKKKKNDLGQYEWK
jgi:hypothetical protein